MVEQKPKSPAGETARFLLVCSGGRWSVREGGDSHGPYLSRRDAFLDAVDAAWAMAAVGAAAEVADLTVTGGERVLWSSARDAYPPAEGAETPRS